MLYSYKGAYPTQLPNRIVLSDGTSRTDRATFTAEEIVDAGWVEVANPPEVTYPNKLYWSGTQWVVRAPNNAETNYKRQEIRDWCLSKLAETDYKVIKAIESGVAVDPVYVTFRQQVRDLYNNVINIQPWDVIYPKLEFPDTE